MRPTLPRKKLIVFDLDGTLTETKSTIDAEMGRLIMQLLKKKPVVIIGGGRYQQFQRQFLAHFRCPPALLRRLSLFPTTATAYYQYHGRWKNIYRRELSPRDRALIKKTFAAVLRDIHYVPPKKVYGRVIEDRRTQVTLSFLGQDVVLRLGARGIAMKKAWKRKYTPLKLKVARMMRERLPHLGVGAAGFTSVDVTKKGVDKGYGIHQIRTHLHVSIRDMVFIGDALGPGGNDYAVRRTGVDWLAVKGPEETKRIIRRILRENP